MKSVAAWLLPVLLPSCTQIVRYTDELTQPQTGRSLFVRTPATFGAVVGFVVGLPFDLVALPVTWMVHASQEDSARDPVSTFLFPSFVLWRAGTLIATPFDALEWCWRSPEQLLGPDERERFERQLDEATWEIYPVQPVYPGPVSR